MQNNGAIKDIFLDILQSLGTGIRDVKVRLEKMKLADLPEEVQVPNVIKNLIGSQEINNIEAKVIYDKFEVDLMTEESMGIKRLFQMICPILNILRHGKILICDELESSLHESVTFEVVRMFQYLFKDLFAQLIFSTHDTNLLNTDLFRRDQIWFTQLNEERAKEYL